MLLMPEQFRDELLAYLSQRPYREVAPAIAALEALQPAPQAPTPSAGPDVPQ